jgi:hypothetical protein
MSRDEFWRLIGDGTNEVDLTPLTAAQLISYQAHFDQLVDKSDTWDLWGAAYLIRGGCSDDSFLDFRYGLIAKGRDVYERAVADPDSLADLDDPEVDDESFGYLALKVYKKRTQQQMPRLERNHSGTAGDEWDFDDEEEMEVRFPRLCAKLDEM